MFVRVGTGVWEETFFCIKRILYLAKYRKQQKFIWNSCLPLPLDLSVIRVMLQYIYIMLYIYVCVCVCRYDYHKQRLDNPIL